MSNKTVITGAALAGLFTGSFSALATSARAPADAGTAIVKLADTTKHDCKGKNACKGQGGCGSSDNGCKGKNSCKGKGGCNPKMK